MSIWSLSMNVCIYYYIMQEIHVWNLSTNHMMFMLIKGIMPYFLVCIALIPCHIGILMEQRYFPLIFPLITSIMLKEDWLLEMFHIQWIYGNTHAFYTYFHLKLGESKDVKVELVSSMSIVTDRMVSSIILILVRYRHVVAGTEGATSLQHSTIPSSILYLPAPGKFEGCYSITVSDQVL